MTPPIPIAAMDDRLGIVGTSGSGKTYNAGLCVEQLLARKARVVVIDPLDVWFGLRVMADGETPSPHNVVIFGGEHADLPINEHAGALIGETVATMAESCIVSFGRFETAASERRFMLAFLTALYRHATRDPLHLIFDEADMFAPQQVVDKEGEATKLLGRMEQIVRRGRIRGFIPWLITQRPAVVNKNVLSQMDGLLAFKLTSSQDRKALAAWVQGQADEGEWKAIYDALPTLRRGTGVVWLPGLGVLETIAFPEKQTFDSSATPKRGEVQRSAQLQALDISALKRQLATVEEETKANDPKALKARISELERAVRQRGGAPDPEALAAAEQRGYDRGQQASIATIRELEGRIAELERVISSVRAAVGAAEAPAEAPDTRPAPAAGNGHDKPVPAPAARRRAPVRAEGAMPKAAAKILAVIDTNPPVRLTWAQACALAGLKARGGSFNTARRWLRESGLVLEDEDTIQIAEPSADAPALSSDPAERAREMRENWRAMLRGVCAGILSELESGNWRDREEIAAALNRKPHGGSWNTAWATLRRNDLVEMSGNRARLADWLR